MDFGVIITHGALKVIYLYHCQYFFVSRTCTLYIMYPVNHIKRVNGIRTICELSVNRALKVQDPYRHDKHIKLSLNVTKIQRSSASGYHLIL